MLELVTIPKNAASNEAILRIQVLTMDSEENLEEFRIILRFGNLVCITGS